MRPPITYWPKTHGAPACFSPTSAWRPDRCRSTPTTRPAGSSGCGAGCRAVTTWPWCPDAGTPLLSDPGERVLRAAVDDGHPVVPLPGASAILAGLVASGLPCVPFTFVGFPPRKAGKRARALERIIDARETTVLFEAPGRLVPLLEELAGLVEGAGGDGRGPGAEVPRRIAVCREMTKVHEEVFRGTPAEGARHYAENPPRGEVTVVIEGRPAGAGTPDAEDVDREAAAALADGLAPTAAAKRVARGTGVSRRDAYEAVMRAKGMTGAGGPA